MYAHLSRCTHETSLSGTPGSKASVCAEHAFVCGGGGEDRIRTGPPWARTEVIYVDLGYWAISGSGGHPEGDRVGRILEARRASERAFGPEVEGSGLVDRGYRLWVTGYGLRVTGYGLRVTGTGFRGYGVRVCASAHSSSPDFAKSALKHLPGSELRV